MNALDKLLAEALASVIKVKLGAKTYQKVEDRLRERYGLTVVEAIKDFHTLDATLREFFGAGADNLERDFLDHLVSLDTKKGQPWVTIENPDLARLILESYGNREKKMILDAALKKPNVILEILEDCKIPKSSGYRIINELVEDGLLAEEGYTTAEGRKVSLYTALFKNANIDIQNGNLVVKVMLKENILHESYLVKILLTPAGDKSSVSLQLIA
ncbi:MAG: transcriptional regulator [Nitrosopumilaceae archaeon]